MNVGDRFLNGLLSAPDDSLFEPILTHFYSLMQFYLDDNSGSIFDGKEDVK